MNSKLLVYKNYNGKKITTMKVGGKIKYFCLCKKIKDLKSIYKYKQKFLVNNINYINLSKILKKKQKKLKFLIILKNLHFYNLKYKNKSLDIKIIGGGSNLIFSDSFHNIIVVKLIGNFAKIKKIKETKKHMYLKIGSGLLLFQLNNFLIKNRLSGYEWSYGIPGTVGGALTNNAGAYGGEFCNKVMSVQYLNNNKIITMKKFNYGYRTSYFRTLNLPIISCVIKLNKLKSDLVNKRCRKYLNKRVIAQPYYENSAGSIFKRKDEFIPAKKIDELKLKGYKICGAEISNKHCGFIINNNNATAKNIIDLIEYVENKLYLEYNVKVEREVEIIGEK